jgi:hypothetical protein
MDKRGLTLTALVKIILAVIIIGFLIYMIYAMFFSEDNSVRQAKSSMEIISRQIEFVDSGEKEEVEFMIESPNDWWILAWPFKDFKNEDGLTVPLKCKKNCVCICPVPGKGILEGWGATKENSLKACSQAGICKETENPVKTIILENLDNEKNSPIYIKGLTPIKTHKAGDYLILKEFEEKSKDFYGDDFINPFTPY